MVKVPGKLLTRGNHVHLCRLPVFWILLKPSWCSVNLGIKNFQVALHVVAILLGANGVEFQSVNFPGWMLT